MAMGYSGTTVEVDAGVVAVAVGEEPESPVIVRVSEVRVCVKVRRVFVESSLVEADNCWVPIETLKGACRSVFGTVTSHEPLV